MVGLSFCDFVGTREEKAKMAEYRKKEWPRRYKVSWGEKVLALHVKWELKETCTPSLCLVALACRMVLIFGSWPCRRGRKDDVLLSQGKLL